MDTTMSILKNFIFSVVVIFSMAGAANASWWGGNDSGGYDTNWPIWINRTAHV